MMLNSPLLDLSGALDTPSTYDPCQDVVTSLVHQLAESLGKAIDAKDRHTLAHSEEVALVAQALALALGLDSRLADHIHVAGHLHDIGKIGVPDHILGKPTALTPGEWEYMRAHPALGADILTPLTCLRQSGVVTMVLTHHERFDGQGYPLGLSGEAIPLGARIIAVADSLSAMVQSRPYRRARGFDEAANEILRCAGTQFDPAVVAAFARIRPEVRDLIASARCASAI
jgi:HD-GYP domain-containing protein (c-di-GMP phosphodiesterase class II)